MVWLEINGIQNNNLIEQLNDYLTSYDKHIFILYYMEGCGPCNATRPEWSKLPNVLPANGLDNDNIVIVSIDQRLSDKLKVGSPPHSFPTMRYITKNGNTIENYEDADFPFEKDRTIDSFVEWIKSKKALLQIQNNSMARKNSKRRRSRTRRIRGTKKIYLINGGKWSQKYKRSINCKRPKGFSQRQYCKYGRNKK